MLSNDEGERYVQGTAQVALPSRAALARLYPFMQHSTPHP